MADWRMGDRYGHQIPSTGIGAGSTIQLGTKSTYVELSLADVVAISAALAEFASTGALAAPLVTARANEMTFIEQNNASGTPQLQMRQGGNVVLMSQDNADATVSLPSGMFGPS